MIAHSGTRWLLRLSGHPHGLFSLCAIELLSRFAFYMMLGVLVLYLSDAEHGGFGYSIVDASRIYGAYLALVFFSPYSVARWEQGWDCDVRFLRARFCSR